MGRREREAAGLGPTVRSQYISRIFRKLQIDYTTEKLGKPLYEANYAQAKDLTLRQADFQQRRIDAAHRRFLASVRTLAQVRKLALPTLQVNIGTNQVNVAESGS